MALFGFQKNPDLEAAPPVRQPVCAPAANLPAAAPVPVPVSPVQPAAAPPPPSPPAPPQATETAKSPDDRVLYRRLMESLYDAVLVVNTSGHIVDANVRAHRLLGYEEGHLWYVPVTTLVPSMTAEVMAKVRQHTAEDRFTVLSAPCTRKDGTRFPAELAIRSTRLINAQDLVFCVRDVERQRMARERHHGEMQAARGSAAGLIVCDAGAVIRYANAAFAGLWGLESELDAVGRPLQDFLPAPEGGEILLAFAAESGACTAERVARDAAGNSFPTVVSVSFQNGGAPELNAYVLTFIGTAGLRTTAVRLRPKPPV